MIKRLLLLALIPLCFINLTANAQVDTSKLDLGRLMLKKEFTQTVTVKGSDLEKMPFDNLADAINVWFYGSYTNAINNVYIIDGNLVNDVNAYSIFDIDEVTLVQNALTRTAGAVQQQQLILIKTKRAQGKGYGITANAEANLSNHYTNNIPSTSSNTDYQTGLKSKTTLYEQYYLSGYYNTGNIQSGISANFLRDALPEATESGVNYITPENFQRLRFNGYFTVKLGTSVLDITAGYAPQKAGEDYTETQSNFYADQNFSQHEHIFNGAIKLTTQILPNFTNVVHADYNNQQTIATTGLLEAEYTDSIAGATRNIVRSHTIVAYDNLSYDAKFGDWGIEPTVNLMFRTLSDSTNYAGESVDNSGNVSNFSDYGLQKEHIFLLTPSVNFYYKSYFNLQAGVLDNLASIGFFNVDSIKKVFPFASASIDVMQLIKPGSSVSIKIYGAYSLSYFWLDNYNMLGDFSSSTFQVPELGLANNDKETASYNTSGNTDYKYYVSQLDHASKSFKNLSAGITVTPFKTGLSFSYFFQQGAYLSPIFIAIPAYANSVTTLSAYSNTNAYLHRFGVAYALTGNSALHWQTGLNATMLEQEYPVNYPGGDPRTGANQWTGGWVNRLTYRDLFAGADLFYQLGERIYTTSTTDPNALSTTKINSFSLQNLYAGYNVKVRGLKGLEVFANARNLFQDIKEDITDDRRYFGLGVKASL